MMASEAQKKELADKVLSLVEQKYGGDWDAMFWYYAGKNGTGTLVDREELLCLLKDAGIGNWMTRNAWADGVMEEVDTTKDARISMDEFRAVVKQN